MVTKRVVLHDTNEAASLFGHLDSNIRQIERDTGAQVFIRHADGADGQWPTVSVRGTHASVDRAIARFAELRASHSGGEAHEGRHGARHAGDAQPDGGGASLVYTSSSGKKIYPRGQNQQRYVELMQRHDMVVAIGPAGTGKTFLAVAQALADLKQGRVSRIVLTRPVVEAGEKLGFLPGDFYDKVNPYLRPLYDAFYGMLGADRFRLFRDDETIEIVPLAYMRGRTLDNSFIILDEAQNTTSGQMKMFLTRMGARSRVVVTGDSTQIDLPDKDRSGLVQLERVLGSIPAVAFLRFSQKDVVRHALVRAIIQAYEAWEQHGDTSHA